MPSCTPLSRAFRGGPARRRLLAEGGVEPRAVDAHGPTRATRAESAGNTTKACCSGPIKSKSLQKEAPPAAAKPRVVVCVILAQTAGRLIRGCPCSSNDALPRILRHRPLDGHHIAHLRHVVHHVRPLLHHGPTLFQIFRLVITLHAPCSARRAPVAFRSHRGGTPARSGSLSLSP